MLASIGSPLVAGALPDQHMVKTIRVRVLRPFLIRGERQEVGAEIEVDVALAAELRHAGKAENAPPPPPPAKPAAAKKE